MREKGTFSAGVHEVAAKVAKTRGSVTYAAEQRMREGKGLDRLVDPSSFDGIRLTGNLLLPHGKHFKLVEGIAMPIQTDVDATASMGGNLDIVFKALPKGVENLVLSRDAILGRYHVQMCTGTVQDECDRYAYTRSQFEPDNEITNQMTLLARERAGGDPTEEYQLGLFAAGYLTRAAIWNYGLKGYYFPVGDQRGRNHMERELLERVFGPKVLEQAFGENIPKTLPSIAEVGKKVLAGWHAFFLQVGRNPGVAEWWERVLGPERIITLPSAELIVDVQTAIVGLTEGALNLQTLVGYLQKAGGVSKADAAAIAKAVANIPMGAQAKLEGFDLIPTKGSLFANREDVWPIADADGLVLADSEPDEPDIEWKL